MPKTRQLKIHHNFITLGQLLKELMIIPSGGMAKWYLQEYEVMVNGELENRRGKKLYDQDKIEFVKENLLVHIVS